MLSEVRFMSSEVIGGQAQMLGLFLTMIVIRVNEVLGAHVDKYSTYPLC